ncbi:MAG: adenylate kinase [Candidatus Altiarchaeota archaeon]
MNVVLLGPPGCGKGTQAEMISERYSIPHVSTGNILRHAIDNRTELGMSAQSYMGRGELVPDEVIDAIVEDRLRLRDCNKGFVLDGFPRNLEQAKSLEEIRSIDCVFDFRIDDRVLIERLSKRRVCVNCGATYHLVGKPPARTGLCDSCGSGLVQRDDDTEQVIRNRLRVYHSSTEPLVTYYSEERNLIILDATKPIMDLFEEICEYLKT